MNGMIILGTILTFNAPHLKTLVINSFLFLRKLSAKPDWVGRTRYPELECLDIKIKYPMIDVLYTPMILITLSQHIKHLCISDVSIPFFTSFPNLESLEIKWYRKRFYYKYTHFCGQDEDAIHLEDIKAPMLHRTKVVDGLKNRMLKIGICVPSLRVLEVQGIMEMEIDPRTMRQLDELRIGRKI